MDGIVRPHRGATVLALGILSLGLALAALGLASQGFLSDGVCTLMALVATPVGLVAFVLGWRQLAGMRTGRIESAGHSKTRTGQALAIVAIFLSGLISSYITVCYPGDQMELYADGSASVTEMYSGPVEKTKYRKVWLPDGRAVKDGPFLLWSRSGNKLEEGSYTEGRREGPWTFWNEDGSIDTTKSGIYEKDVRVDERVPSPAGDYGLRSSDGQPRPPRR